MPSPPQAGLPWQCSAAATERPRFAAQTRRGRGGRMRQTCASDSIDTRAAPMPARAMADSTKITYKKYCILLPCLAAAFTSHGAACRWWREDAVDAPPAPLRFEVTDAVRGMWWCAGKPGRRY